jgi:hypothetical protein
MKRFLMCLSLLSVSAFGAEMVGYISDANCGAKNANDTPTSQECAKTCVKGGSEPVFVTASDQKVYKLSDKAKVMEHVGHKVVIDGKLSGDTLEVASIKMAK